MPAFGERLGPDDIEALWDKAVVVIMMYLFEVQKPAVWFA